MADKEKNWAAWYDNEPKYKKGDICLFEEEVYTIEDVIFEAYSAKHKKSVEKRISERRNCCGQKGRGVREENFSVEYTLSNGKTIHENHLKVGIEEINEYIKRINTELESSYERINRAAEAMGFSNDY